MLPKWKQKWTAQGKKVDRHKETKKNSSLVLGLQQIKIKSNVFESLVSPKKTLNTIWTSDGRLNIWSARQVGKTTQRFKVKVALTYADSSSLPLVLHIFKGHPLFTMITIQNIGKGLEVVASPADPRLQRYVSFNNGLETITYHEQKNKCNACFHTSILCPYLLNEGELLFIWKRSNFIALS